MVAFNLALNIYGREGAPDVISFFFLMGPKKFLATWSRTAWLLSQGSKEQLRGTKHLHPPWARRFCQIAQGGHRSRELSHSASSAGRPAGPEQKENLVPILFDFVCLFFLSCSVPVCISCLCGFCVFPANQQDKDMISFLWHCLGFYTTGFGLCGFSFDSQRQQIHTLQASPLRCFIHLLCLPLCLPHTLLSTLSLTHAYELNATLTWTHTRMLIAKGRTDIGFCLKKLLLHD